LTWCVECAGKALLAAIALITWKQGDERFAHGLARTRAIDSAADCRPCLAYIRRLRRRGRLTWSRGLRAPYNSAEQQNICDEKKLSAHTQGYDLTLE
jgi:hypothetical protein